MRYVSRFRVLLLGLIVCWGLAARADVCDKVGVVEAPVSRILTLVTMRLGADVPPNWNLTAAHVFAQKHLMRAQGDERLSERSLLQYKKLFSVLRAADIAALEANLAEAGFCDAIEPPSTNYDYILINGAAALSVRKRIDAVARAIGAGTLRLSPKTRILFLDGERKLFASETAQVLLDPSPYAKDARWVPPAVLPTDERGMNELLWQQMYLPEVLRKQGIVFIHAQKQAGSARAETADCVRAWVQAHHPQRGRALVVSNNPFVEYQRRVTEVLLEKSGAHGFEVTAMGPAAELHAYDPATRLGLLLDALAGTLFRAKQQQDLGLLHP